MKRGRPFESKSLPERLSEYTSRDGGCLVWNGYRDKDGYGIACIKMLGDDKAKNRKVHRLVWEEAFGPIPDGLVVMHVCDRPECVELDHLRLGTPRANARDRDRKGRANQSRDVKGSKNPNAKLTDEQVAEIRRRHKPGERVGLNTTASLALEFGVHRGQIQRIVRGEQRC